MPLFRKDESLPKRKVIILIHGEPGLGKTSLFNTCNGLLIDFEDGVSRSHSRKDTLIVDRKKGWQDVLEEEANGTFNGYTTIGIDTPKSMLDETLMPFVKNRDYALVKNTMKAYGVMGDEARDFYNRLRACGADIINMVHTVSDKDGDKIIKTPDVTGQTLQFLKRISDQIGYMYSENGKRVLDFRIQDGVVTKDTAGLGKMSVPDVKDAAYEGWLIREVINKVRDKMEAMDESQLAALKYIEDWRSAIDTYVPTDGQDINLVWQEAGKHVAKIEAEHIKKQIRAYLVKHIDNCGYEWVAAKKAFLPKQAPEAAAANPPAQPPATPPAAEPVQEQPKAEVAPPAAEPEPVPVVEEEAPPVIAPQPDMAAEMVKEAEQQRAAIAAQNEQGQGINKNPFTAPPKMDLFARQEGK